MTPEENRDRILAAIDAPLRDGYLAPEIIRSKLYAFFLEEIERFAIDRDARIEAWLRHRPAGETAESAAAAMRVRAHIPFVATAVPRKSG